VRYLRDLCGEKEALERAQEKQLIATKLVAQGRKNPSAIKSCQLVFFSRIAHSSFITFHLSLYQVQLLNTVLEFLNNLWGLGTE
jgi:hypothetical protein